MSCPTRVAALRALAALIVVLAIVAAACSGPAPHALSDPKAILQAGISGVQEAKTFHVEGTASGKMVLSLGRTSAAGSGAPITLDGSTLTGDADLAGKRASLSLSVPALFGLTADVVAVDQVVYTRLPIPGSGGWTRQAGAGSMFDALADPAGLLDQLGAFLDRQGVAPRKLSNEHCGDTDCYAVSFTIPAAQVGADAGSAGAPPTGALPGGLVLGDIAVTALVRTDAPRLVMLSFDVPLGAGGTINLALELSKFGDPVTITPPPGI